MFLSNPAQASTFQDGLKQPPSGLVRRGKGEHTSSYCDLARGINIDGGYCQLLWSDLQSAPFNQKYYLSLKPKYQKKYIQSRFDFSKINQAIKVAQKFNAKKLQRLNKEGTNHPQLPDTETFKVLLRSRTGVYSPQWVKDSVGTITWYFKNFKANQTYQLTLFWTSYYQNAYQDMMQVLAWQYDDHPLIGGVAASMCMTVHSETMWNRTGRSNIPHSNPAIKKELREINMTAMRHSSLGSDKYTNHKDYRCLERQVETHDVWKKTPTFFGSHPYQELFLNTRTANIASQVSDITYVMEDSRKEVTLENKNKTLNLFHYCRSVLGQRCILGNNSLKDSDTVEDGNIYWYLEQVGSPVYFQTNVFKSDDFQFNELIKTLRNAGHWHGLMVEVPMGWDCKGINSKTECSKKQADKKSTLKSVINAR